MSLKNVLQHQKGGNHYVVGKQTSKVGSSKTRLGFKESLLSFMVWGVRSEEGRG